MINDVNYYKFLTIDQVLQLLQDFGEKTAIMARGTDLIVNMKKGLIVPKNIVDIKSIKELTRIEDTKDGLFIGAGVSCNQLIYNKFVNKYYPVLVEAVKSLGSHQIRNRATIVGNICNASPAADTAPALLVLETKVIIRSKKEKRIVPLNEFFTGVKRTQLTGNELVIGLIVDLPIQDAQGKYLKKSRIKGPDLSTVGVAGLFSKQLKVEHLAYVSVSVIPILVDVSYIIFGQNDNLETKTKRVLEKVLGNLIPITDIRSTSKYRQKIAEVYTKKILKILWKGEDN